MADDEQGDLHEEEEEEEEAVQSLEPDNSDEHLQHDDEDDDDDEDEDDDDDCLCDDEKLHYLALIGEAQFQFECKRIEDNDSELQSVEYCNHICDDRATKLGRALIGNKHLAEFSLSLSLLLTSAGAQALVGGILGSNIKALSLYSDYEVPFEMAQICSKSLQSLELSIEFDDDFAIQLRDSLTGNRSLERLSLFLIGITPRGAQALCDLIRGDSMKSLEFHVERSVPAGGTMQTLYLEGVKRCCNLEKLNVKRNIGNMNSLVAASLPQISELCIEDADLSLSDVEILSSGLKKTNRLTSLRLAGCKLGCEHMSVLSSVVGSHPSIKTLDLNSNNVGDAGVALFVENWAQKEGEVSVITCLSMAQSKLSAHGALLLMRALLDDQHDTVQELHLDKNDGIGYDGLKLIGDILPGTKLQELHLFDTANYIKYKDETCDAAVLQKAQRMEAGRALLEGVRGSFHLSVLEIGSVDLDPDIVNEIEFYIEANKCGRQLLQDQHTLPPAVWSYFFAQKRMSCNIDMIFFFLRELPSSTTMMNPCDDSGKKRKRM